MSKAHLPPVPPESRSTKGPDDGHVTNDPKGKAPEREERNQGRSGNIAENTTNQGHQQDR